MIDISTIGIIAYMDDCICYWFTSFVDHLTLDSDMCLQTTASHRQQLQ